MASRDEREEHIPRGNEWEVVSLTASAYAAAPGPDNVELKDDQNAYEAETSRALFMSGHFVFPPSEHENLPVEPFLAATCNDKISKDVDPSFEAEKEEQNVQKEKKGFTIKGVDLPNQFQRVQFCDETGIQEQSIYGESTLGSFHGEIVGGGSTMHEHGSLDGEPSESSEGGLGFLSDASNPLRPAKDAMHAAYNVPCEAWWRRRAASVYAHAKEANAFWSLFIAAAVTGLVVLGQRWQQERWQVLQLKWQSSISNEKSSRIFGPISRLKDVIVGGNRRASFIRGSSDG